jgi:hypothetical protein
MRYLAIPGNKVPGLSCAAQSVTIVEVGTNTHTDNRLYAVSVIP